MTRPKVKIGRPSVFTPKVRSPVSVTLSKRHHTMVRKAMRRLGVTRADLLGLLIEKGAESVTLDGIDLPPAPAPRRRKRSA